MDQMNKKAWILSGLTVGMAGRATGGAGLHRLRVVVVWGVVRLHVGAQSRKRTE